MAQPSVQTGSVSHARARGPQATMADYRAVVAFGTLDEFIEAPPSKRGRVAARL